MRKERLRRPKAAKRHGEDRCRRAHGPRRTRFDRWGLARHALLEEQLRRLHSRVGVKALDHPIGKERVGQGDERHAFVVSQVGANDDAGHIRRPGLRCGVRVAICVVDGVKQSVLPLETDAGEPSQVGRARRRIDHRGQCRRVRSHNQLVAQAALQAEAGNAECFVLVRLMSIDDVVGRLRDSPGHPAGCGVVPLVTHGHSTGLVEQRVRVAPHDEERHQILEQRRAPREQHGCAADAGHQSSEMEPVRLGHVALGDSEEAGKPRLGGQEVVVRRVEPAWTLGVGETIPDREQPALRFVQEREIHVIEQRRCARRQRRRQLPQPDGERDERAREIPAVDRRDVARRQRRERPRVVPVQQMAFDPLESFDRGECRVNPIDQRIGVDEPEVVRRERREEAHADIGGRRPVCDVQFGRDLDAVGREAVILASGERLEVPPRFQRDRGQILAVGQGEDGAASWNGSAQRERDQRCGRPQGQNGHRDAQRARMRGDDDHEAADRDRRACHHAGEEGPRPWPSAPRSVRGCRLPFQQTMPSDTQANERNADCVEPLVGLVCHERELQCGTSHGGLHIFGGRSHEGGPRLLATRTTEHFREARADRKGERGKAGRRPHRRTPRQDGPSEEQQHDGGRRHEAAAEVVENFPTRDERESIALET